MSSFGRVIGGAYLDAGVTTATFGSDLVIQTGIKGRKLTSETIESWQEIPVEVKDGAFTAMGKAAAGVALPGRFGRAASAAVGAAFDSKKPDHHVRVVWNDGKQSLLKLPESLFTHLDLVLSDHRLADAEPKVVSRPESDEAQPTIVDKTFDLVSGLVKDRFPAQPQAVTEVSTPAAQSDITEQLHKLGSLRDAGILTDAEFTSKKAELLARL
ncbi:SHOCT domain-containing protein [Plantibacter sp. VKM Ac-2880]|uniref:SHOCT domain-containing protein n=1 Tax=Plantibacter sp. VKM Ac-2880 TaxID=2783827 RepID=UPI00188FDA90|nr:SHOCT domain-containing protein [Plantibacter sp. VKM Ac-2880]MBF4567194.1 SHOCT domain-containing protein [Plantibacter sp. VKM Ac-2880]